MEPTKREKATAAKILRLACKHLDGLGGDDLSWTQADYERADREAKAAARKVAKWLVERKTVEQQNEVSLD